MGIQASEGEVVAYNECVFASAACGRHQCSLYSFAMARPELSAVVVGFKSPQEIDEAIERINRALANG
jgi:hypothetical protein